MDGYIGCGTQGRRAMRVIAGKYRSRPLRTLRGMDIRPTSDKLRETLFNVLTAGNPAALEGSVWLDLFAGTGAVGIEALSRGAKEVHFVENAAPAADAIRKNLQSLGIKDGFKDHAGRIAARILEDGEAASRSRCGVYRSAVSHERRVHKYAASAGGFFLDLGDVGGDCRTRKEIRSGRGIRVASPLSASGAGQHGIEFLSHGQRWRLEDLRGSPDPPGAT